MINTNTPSGKIALLILLSATQFNWTSWAQAQARDLDTPVNVSAMPLQNLASVQRQSATATVVAANHAIVAATVTGSIVTIAADVGSEVKQDQELGRLDAGDYELALEQAAAQLNAMDAQIEQAQQRLDRANELSGSQYISADDLLARQTDLAVLTANRVSQQIAVKIAQRDLDKTTIRAPFAATVVARPAQLGSLAVAGSPLFELVQLDNREVEASVASDLVDGLRNGSSVLFERNGSTHSVELLRISPVAQSVSGTQLVRLKFNQTRAVIGSSGRLTWASPNQQLAPSYLSQRDGSLGVFIVEQNRARFHPLPDAQEGRAFVVNLAEDAQIVTTGRTKLQDGQAVNVFENRVGQ